MKLFAKKVALVTGAGRGIGAEIARELGRAGATVIVHYHSTSAGAESVAREIESAGGTAFPLQADLSSPDSITSIVARAVKEFGRIDFLINNAATFGISMDVTPPTFQREFAVNVLAPVLLMQAVEPHMPAGGRVINISSISGIDPNGPPTYCATKAALNAYTRSFAERMGPKGITVVALAPGATDTDENEWFDSAAKASVASHTALKRHGTAKDIAASVMLLLEERATWLNGQIIRADGGLYPKWR